MLIKKLQLKDAELATVLVKKFKGKANVDIFLSNNNCLLVGAFDDDKPVGILIGYKLVRPDTERLMFYIHDIDVDEIYRRQGIATKMIKIVKEEAVNSNYLKIFIITNKNNQAAMELYKSIDGQTPHDDDIVFVWEKA